MTSKRSNVRPEISVITPVYNAEKYLLACLTSVLEQDENLELIVVNDGSTDRSEEIIKSLRDKRIKYFSQKNQGPWEARNRAIFEAKGRYIINVDADDMLFPRALLEKKTVLEDHKNKNLVLGNQIQILKSGEISALASSNYFLSQMSERTLLSYAVRFEGGFADNQPMWRAETLQKIGGYKKVFAEDWEILVRALSLGLGIAFSSTITGFYRHTGNSFSQGSHMGAGYEKFLPGRRVEHRDWIMLNMKALIKKMVTDETVISMNPSVFIDLRTRHLVLIRDGIKKDKEIRLSDGQKLFLELCSERLSVKELLVKCEDFDSSDQVIREMIFKLFIEKILDLESMDS